MEVVDGNSGAEPAATVDNSSNDEENLFKDVVKIVFEFLTSAKSRTSKVVEFRPPDELRALIDLSLGEDAVSDKQVLDLCKEALAFSVHTSHPRMFNTLFSGVDFIGLSGSVLSSAANTNVYTYEMAPVFTLMEKEVLSKMREYVGWSSGNGIFAPGGSVSNLYGMLASRYHKFPETKTRGCSHLPQLTLFTSHQAHYSVEKAAILMGLGTDNVIKVRCDSMGRMDPNELEKSINDQIRKGSVPIVVVGTAGTTVLAAFDPIQEIADICQRHNVWFHVDGSYGGSCLMSQKYKHLCKGIERADSVTWNPHKALHAPLLCSAFLTRHESILKEMLSLHASYLFQKDKVLYDVSMDTGDMSLQCGRVNDAFKLWLMWKRNGLSWAGKEIDRQIMLADYLRDKIRGRVGFQLVTEEQQYSNVSFWYIPSCLRGIDKDDDWKQRLNKVAPILKAKMVKKGTMMISYQPLEDHPNFLRMVTVSTAAKPEDMDFVLDEIERLGVDIVV